MALLKILKETVLNLFNQAKDFIDRMVKLIDKNGN
jgi:hypothetical protein